MQRKTFILLTALLLLLCQSNYSQTLPSPGLKSFMPASPNAAGLGKYGDVDKVIDSIDKETKYRHVGEQQKYGFDNIHYQRAPIERPIRKSSY